MKAKSETKKVTRDEMVVIMRIVARAFEQIPTLKKYGKLSLLMDLEACQADVPLGLEQLLLASPFDFAHDVVGIINHMDRQTKKLSGCFLPRYAKQEAR